MQKLVMACYDGRMNTEQIKHLETFGTAAARVIWAKLVKMYSPKLHTNMPRVVLNNRFKTCGGVCKVDIRVIELSTEMFWHNQEEYLTVIIPHEIIHLVDYDLTGNVGHGPTWKEIMRAYGLPPNRLHTLTNPIQDARVKARAAKCK